MAEYRYFTKMQKLSGKNEQTTIKKLKVEGMPRSRYFSPQNISDEDKKAEIQKRKEQRDKARKLKQIMKKRLIIRNLSFKVNEEQLKEIFSKYGDVEDVSIPLTDDGKKRGFAFIRYKDAHSQFAAVREMNFKKIEGRPIAIDVAVSKKNYQSNMKTEKPAPESEAMGETSESDEDVKPNIKVELTSDSSDDGEDKNEDNKLKSFLKEFDADKDEDADVQSVGSSDDSSEDDDNNEDENESLNSQEIQSPTDKTRKRKKLHDVSTDETRKRKESNDVSEGKTIFIRNISFKNTEEDLQYFMEEYGEMEYCLLCYDPVTDHPKGTGFVKFKSKESADKVIEKSYIEPGLILDGRKLLCTYAISRGDVSKIGNEPNKVKDKRNLSLLKCSLIMQGSPEAEGLSQGDITKRAQLEMVKKQKLRNVNFFVSDKRLAIHNLPKNITDKDLHAMFKKAGGKGAIVKEAKVMRDFTKTDAAGHPVSRGYGFVSFTEHQHALKAVADLNNNSSIFTPLKRPIVEFSVENKVALYAQEKKRERMQMKNKKRTEEKIAQKKLEENEQQSQQNMNNNNKKKERKNKGRNSPNKKSKRDERSTQPSAEAQSTNPKKTQNRTVGKFLQKDTSEESKQQSRQKKSRSNKNRTVGKFLQKDTSEESKQQSHQKKSRSNKGRRRKNKVKRSFNKESALNLKSPQSSGATQSSKSKKKQTKPQKNTNKVMKLNNQEHASLSQLANKYKEKLQNKLL